MASNGLLKRLPELLTALGVGAYGYGSSDDDDEKKKLALAAAMGIGGGGAVALGRGVRGLLRKVPTYMVTQADKNSQAVALRRALGQTPQQSTRMITNDARDAMDHFGEMLAMEKYGDRLGGSQLDDILSDVGRRGNQALDGIGGLGKRAWDAADYIGERAAPKDRWRETKDFVAENWLTPTILGGAAGAAAIGYDQTLGGAGQERRAREEDEATKEALAKAMGFENTPTGLMVFQAGHDLPPTGKWTDETINAIAEELELQKHAKPKKLPMMDQLP